MPYIPVTTHVTLLTTLRRERSLPVPGEVLARSGQHVEAMDVVARAIIPDEHRILDVARELDVPKDKAGAFMTKQDGEPVKKGEAIALRKTLLGLMEVPVVSPVDGLLVAAGDGRALLAAVSKPYELRAGIPGNVINVLEGRGVVIETTGALLEGVWGNGKDQFALLRMLSNTARDTLLAEQIELGLRGAIVAAGTLQDASAFKQLMDVGIRGLIVGSARADLLLTLQKWDIPVLVTDGFGAQGFSGPAFTLLSSNTGREIWLNAQTWNRFAGERPEAIIPLPSPGQAPALPPEGEALAVDKRVRVVRGAEAGLAGAVTAISERAVALPSGVRARVANVKFDEGGQTRAIPFANLEILG